MPEHPWRGWPGPGFLLIGVALLAATIGVLGGIAVVRAIVRRGTPRAKVMAAWPLVAAAAGGILYAAGIFWGIAIFFAVALGLGPWPFVDEKGN